MKRILLLVGALALVAIVAATVFLNPSEVDFRPTHIHSFRPSLGVLLIITFVGGVVLAALGGALRSVSGRLATWGGRRAVRRSEQAEEWRRDGLRMVWEGDLDHGRSLLRKAWKRRPSDIAAALALASSYLDTGENTAAEEMLAAAVAYDASDPDLRFALGEALRRRGNLDEAIRMLETVRVHHPRAPRALITLRELYRERGDWKNAAEVQAIYLESLPSAVREREHATLVNFLYQAALALPEPAERRKALEALLQADRSFVPALVSLGDTLAEQGAAGEGRRVWEKAFKNVQRLVFIERLLATATTAREREQALGLLGKYGQSAAPDALHILLARSALDNDDPDRAEIMLARVSRQEDPVVQRCWADIYRRRGDQGGALSALVKAADALGAATIEHRCSVCGQRQEAWAGYCEHCRRWDTYRSGFES